MRELICIAALYLLTKQFDPTAPGFVAGTIFVLGLGTLIFLCMCLTERLFMKDAKHRYDPARPYPDMMVEEDAAARAENRKKNLGSLADDEYGLDAPDAPDVPPLSAENEALLAENEALLAENEACEQREREQ